MAGIEAAATTAVVGVWGTKRILAERHREMAVEYRRLSTIGSSTEVRSYNLRMAEHYSLLADVEAIPFSSRSLREVRGSCDLHN